MGRNMSCPQRCAGTPGGFFGPPPLHCPSGFTFHPIREVQSPGWGAEMSGDDPAFLRDLAHEFGCFHGQNVTTEEGRR